MTYLWFKIFNLAEFEATGLVSKAYTLDLEGVGLKTVLVTKGNSVSMSYEGVFLPLEMSGENPFEFDSHAIFKDGSDDVYLGLPVT